MLLIVVASVVVGALVAAAGLGVPPLNLLNHEMAGAFTAVGTPLWVLICRVLAKRLDEHDALWRGLAGVLGLTAGVLAVHIPWDGIHQGCRTDDGVGLFLTTWVPAGVLATVGGVAAARTTWARTVAAVGGTLLALAIHDGGQILFGVRLVDPLLGSLEAFDQRADLERPPAWFAERAWLMLTAAVLWAGHRWRQDRTRRGPLAVVGGTWLLGTVLFNSTLGLGWGGGRIEHRLGAVYETDNFRVHHGQRGTGPAVAAAIAREAEYQRWVLNRDLHLDQPGEESPKVDLWVFEGRDHIESLTGKRSAHAFIHRVNIPWHHAFTDTLRHELVHAYHWDLSPHPVLWLNRAVMEGSGEAWESGAVWSKWGHEDAAALLSNGHLPALRELLSLSGFWSLDEGLAYKSAGSFIGWLVANKGGDKFREFNRTGDLEATYGETTEELEAAWHATLSELPTRAKRRRQMRKSYDPKHNKGYLKKKCPKLGRTTDGPPKRAEELEDRKAWADAGRIWTRLFEKRPLVSHAARGAEALRQAGDLDRALSLLTAADALDDNGKDEQLEIAEIRVRVVAASGDVAATQAALAGAAALRRKDDRPVDLALDALLLDPVFQEDTLALLQEADRGPRRRAAARMLDRYPDDPRIGVIYGAWGLNLPIGSAQFGTSPEELLYLDQALDFIANQDGACAGSVNEMQETGLALARLGDIDRATRILSLLEDRCTAGPASLAAMEIRLRLEWEAEVE
jgi:hypothetical protein